MSETRPFPITRFLGRTTYAGLSILLALPWWGLILVGFLGFLLFAMWGS